MHFKIWIMQILLMATFADCHYLLDKLSMYKRDNDHFRSLVCRSSDSL